ncbi:MAG: peptidylprolyl isomerase [bacterium]
MVKQLSLSVCLLLLSTVSFAQEKNPVVSLYTGKGSVSIELYPEQAPKTVDNFLKLVKNGFYNGLVFHRYVPGFIIQGGDPKGDGTGGPGYTIPDEHVNGLKHVKGAVAMARTSEPDSAGSQFYLCLGPAHFLDNQYTVFGKVVSGMENVLKLRKGDVIDKIDFSQESLINTGD